MGVAEAVQEDEHIGGGILVRRCVFIQVMVSSDVPASRQAHAIENEKVSGRAWLGGKARMVKVALDGKSAATGRRPMSVVWKEREAKKAAAASEAIRRRWCCTVIVCNVVQYLSSMDLKSLDWHKRGTRRRFRERESSNAKRDGQESYSAYLVLQMILVSSCRSSEGSHSLSDDVDGEGSDHWVMVPVLSHAPPPVKPLLYVSHHYYRLTGTKLLATFQVM
nr:hypothetical protein CFP56_58788 [Quercus suber]